MKKFFTYLLKAVLSGAVLYISAYLALFILLIFSYEGFNGVVMGLIVLLFPTLAIPIIWIKKRKKVFLWWLIFFVAVIIACGANYGIIRYNESITINTSPNIKTSEYMPFDENSKIVKVDSQTLKFDENPPKIDGAAALFPVYSAFVNAVYPETTRLYDGCFEYNNTPVGYSLLADKETDVFIGVYPSKEQIEYAEKQGTTFRYTPIGSEAFVFFVHKDNPIENLTSDMIKGIYSGEITNWEQVGGNNEKIAAFQRNEGSGSQSMLKRFMGDTPIMTPPTEMTNDLMSGIVEEVSDYKNKDNSIGFSFRYYIEGLIKNPDIKLLSVDGIAPTVENIKNGAYPIVTPIYAVTYEENDNENTQKLIDWILSDEGQYIIEETGYSAML